MSDATSETPEHGGDDFGLSAVRELLRLLEQSDVTEILIERGESRLHVKRTTGLHLPPNQLGAPAPSMPNAAMPTQPMFVSNQPLADGDPLVEMPAGYTVVAPMVGIFYTSPSPKDEVFVEEGDEIRAGDTVGIIEAMKMMNEIECDIGGRVARILVQNGQPVEYGQPIMVIEPI